MPSVPDPASLPPQESPRRIALGEHLIDYHLRRARRRTIGLSIDHRGLRVGAPLRAPLGEIEDLIRRHAEWISRKLAEWRTRPQPAPMSVTDGTTLPFLGGTLTVRLARGNNPPVWAPPTPPNHSLTLCLRQPEAAPRVLEAALREQARELFAERLFFFSARLGLPVPQLSLSSAKTRWGSCNRRGEIRLNWRLVHFPRHLIDYVVAHEVAHLVEMNHGPRFWHIVERLYPDHQQARAMLRQAASGIPASFSAAEMTPP